MCIYPHGSRFFIIARTLILLSLTAQLTTVSLDFIPRTYYKGLHSNAYNIDLNLNRLYSLVP